MGGLGKGTRNIGINVPVELREQLQALADASGMTLSAYCRMILEGEAERQTVFRLQQTTLNPTVRYQQVAEDPEPTRKKRVPRRTPSEHSKLPEHDADKPA